MVLMKSEHKLKKGDKAPDFNLVGTDDKSHNLSDLKGSAYLVIFMCNHCPYVLGKLSELNRIHEDFKDKGLVVIGINSNEDENYPEDSFDNMKKFVNSGKIKFTYLRDETQETAKSYGATCTPDPFLFDKDLRLIHHGRIDDEPGPEDGNKKELYEAIKEFLDTGEISLEEKPSMGCSIKWME